jgi:TonB family protein
VAALVAQDPGTDPAGPSATMGQGGVRTWGAAPDRKAHPTFVASNPNRWRAALEGYVPVVRPGDQTALTSAQIGFATYLNGMHVRIHPIFASFLASLDDLPPDDPLNDPHLVVRLELVVAADGRIQQLGIVRTSGITAFDVAALDSVDRAQPFQPTPTAIRSPDGNVYLHWEFHRNERLACSTWGSRPFVLSGAPGSPRSGPSTGPR